MAKKKAQTTASEASFRIVGLHANIRNVFVMQTRKSYDLDALTKAQAAELLSARWEHIEALTPNP